MAQDEDAATIDRPSPGGVGLMIIDMINDMAFPGAETMLGKADRVADVILALREQADALEIPVIYVNDNYGQWHSEKSRIVEKCAGGPGGAIVRKIAPRDDDYFVIKPQFSGFYATNLPVLLPKLGVSRLVITGIAADICVLFTAADAHMRAYDLWIPSDTVASEADERTRWALEIMQKSMQAKTQSTSDWALKDWLIDKSPEA